MKNKNQGFTLIEMLIVIAIIGLLATIVIVNVMGALKSGRDKKRQTDVNQLALAASLFMDKYGCVPGSNTGSNNCYGASQDWRQDLSNFIDADKVRDPLHPDSTYKYQMQTFDSDGDGSIDNCAFVFYSETLEESITKQYHEANPNSQLKPAYCRN